MLKYLFFILLAYFLYRFVFNFVIPIYRTTRKVKRGFREMQERMQQQARQYEQQQQPAAVSQQKSTTQKPSDGDYIDFEEVK